jgi:hypothetical protein
MHVFLDFEASSLEKDSYPIEVGWVFEDGTGAESWRIRPAPDWTDWDPRAEAIHGIACSELVATGSPPEAVASRILAVLGPHRVFVSAPSWDGKWLSTLLRAAGLPRHAMRLGATADLLAETATTILGARLSPEGALAAATALVSTLRAEAETWPAAHRALADAERERAIWLELRRRAEALVGQQDSLPLARTEGGGS